MQPVNAKCGTRRIHHWAHLPETPCTDRWWETETDWHRAWKDKFPREWQEFVQHDQSGEKHIADVQTNHGLVVEFQHSHLDPQERAIREQFYGNMVWIVDGTRLKRDYPRFTKGHYLRRAMNNVELYTVPIPDKCFPANWLESSVPVLLDFLGTAPIDPPDNMRQLLWCLLPGRAEGSAVLIPLSREEFVAAVSNSPQFLPVHEIIAIITQQIKLERTRPAVVWQRMAPRRSRRF